MRGENDFQLENTEFDEEESADLEWKREQWEEIVAE